MDDTPNAERLQWYHRSGTYEEIDASGQRVNKIVGDDYEVVVKNKTVFIQGNLNVQVQGNITVTGNVTLDGNLKVSGYVKGKTIGSTSGSGVDLGTHVHEGVTAGPDNTGIPH